MDYKKKMLLEWIGEGSENEEEQNKVLKEQGLFKCNVCGEWMGDITNRDAPYYIPIDGCACARKLFSYIRQIVTPDETDDSLCGENCNYLTVIDGWWEKCILFDESVDFIRSKERQRLKRCEQCLSIKGKKQ